jgi:hypothetical protein
MALAASDRERSLSAKENANCRASIARTQLLAGVRNCPPQGFDLPLLLAGVRSRAPFLRSGRSKLSSRDGCIGGSPATQSGSETLDNSTYL